MNSFESLIMYSDVFIKEKIKLSDLEDNFKQTLHKTSISSEG